MATYTYFCKNCTTFLQAQHSVNEEPEITCPSCRGAMTRRPQSVGIELKGTGWGKDR